MPRTSTATATDRTPAGGAAAAAPVHAGLYTPEQRARRDATRWTLVQGLLAPLQIVVFVVSLALVLRFLLTGEGLAAATA